VCTYRVARKKRAGSSQGKLMFLERDFVSAMVTDFTILRDRNLALGNSPSKNRVEGNARTGDRDVLSGGENRSSNQLENRYPLRRQPAVCVRATPYMYELAPLLLTERESLYRVMYVKILAVCYRLRARMIDRSARSGHTVTTAHESTSGFVNVRK